MEYTYTDLRFYEKAYDMFKNQEGNNKKAFEQLIIDCKKYLRKKNRIDSEYEKVMVKDYGIDGCVIKFPLPVHITTKEEADDYFMDYEYIYYRPTYYDCTGQTFTSWYKIFRRTDGRFMAYHRISIDL